METLGQFLKREREFRGVTLEEVSKATKISPTFLQNIEADRFDVLPKGAFLKGFLRSYARTVGLDPDEVLSHHRAPSGTLGQEEDPFMRFRRFEARNRIYWVVAVLVVIVALAAILSVR